MDVEFVAEMMDEEPDESSSKADSNKQHLGDSSSKTASNPLELGESSSKPETTSKDEKVDFTGDISNVDVRDCFTERTVASIDEAEDVYRLHANAIGFCYRKGTSRRDKEGVIFERYLLCSCQGKPESTTVTPPTLLQITDGSKIGSRPRKRKAHHLSKSECKAEIRIKLIDGVAKVMHHIVLHNHPLNRPEWQQFVRSERRITPAVARIIIGMEVGGLRPSQGYDYLTNEACGEEAIRHQKRDQINFVGMLRTKKIEEGDANTVLKVLEEKHNKDPDFYFKALIVGDEENKTLSALFWRDSMMKEDFMLYSDVVVFDTTFCTNRYNLICGLFVGVNNHGKNVMFACAFIFDEKTETFEWLLKTFKKSMDGNTPQTIFTDQDQAMATAIEKVFPDTCHRLCLWHIKQNAIKHYEKLKKDKPFKQAFDHCLNGCINELEFEECWNSMITEYNLQEHSWFQRLYGLRRKWCSSFSRDFFSVGTLATQRFESTNHAISIKANKTTSLTQFEHIFEKMVKKWRVAEQKDESDCIRFRPKSARARLLKHAAEVYTMNIYEDFKKIFNAAMATTVVEGTNNNNYMRSFEVTLEETNKSDSVLLTTASDKSVELFCSCRAFETTGMLCFHSIRVLHLLSISRIPDQYILPRWTKDVKKDIWTKYFEQQPSLTVSKLADAIPWRHTMARKFYSLIVKSSESLEGRKIIEDAYKRGSESLQKILASASSEATTTSSASASSTVPHVMDPKAVTTKGMQKR